MRNISTHAAALALGVAPKVMDNVLAREARSLAGPGRRGKSRRITFATIERVAIAFVLHRDLGVSIARGLELAAEVLRVPAGAELALGSLTALRFDAARLRLALESAVIDAMSECVPARRGRLPRDTSASGDANGAPR